MSTHGPRRTGAALSPGVLALSALAVAAPALVAQERIYVSQLNPPTLHTLELTGGGFVADPDGTGPLATPFEAWGLAATDHLLLIGNVFNAVGFAAQSPNGIALPAIESPSAGTRAAFWVIGDWALYAGGQPGAVGVASIDPTSPDYLRQVSGLALGVGISDAAALSPDGETLYVVRTAGGFPGFAAMIDAVDITDLPNLTLRHTTAIASPVGFDRGVDSLKAFTLGGADYLMMFRRDVQFLALDPGDATPSLHHTLSLGHPSPSAGTMRRFHDGDFDAASERAIVTAETLAVGGLAFHEMLLLDLSGLDDGPPAVSVLAEIEYVAPESRTESNNQLKRSLDGTKLVLLDRSSPPAPAASEVRVHAWTTAALYGASGVVPYGGLPPIDSFEIAPGPQSVQSVGWMIRERVVAASPEPTIVAAVDDSSGAALIENDEERTLRYEGSGLDGVERAFLGSSWLADATAVSSSQATATVAPLTPAADTAAGVVTTNEAVVRKDGVKIVNPGDFLPGTVAYVATSDLNRVTVLNSATEEQVVTNIPAVVQGPNGVAVTRDGKLLFTSGFRGGGVAVHCLVADPTGLGCDWNEHVTSIGGEGCCPTDLELSADGTKLFVDGIWPTVDVIDTTASPPAYLASIWISTLDDDPFRGNIRRIALAPVDGNGREWLYLANDRPPHVLAVDVTGVAADIAATEVQEFSIPGLGVGRSDGLVVDPHRSRLYFHHFWDPTIHVFAIDPDAPDASRLTLIGEIEIPDGESDVRNLALRPDGRYLYAGGRATGQVQIFDLGAPEDDCFGEGGCAWPVHVGFVETGAQTNRIRISPAGDYLFVPAFGPQMVSIIDLRDGDTLHRVLTTTATSPGPGDVAFSPGVATEPGGDVTVTPTEGVEVTFDDVIEGGSTTVTSANVSEIPLAADFEIAGGTTPVYYDVSTTAEFEGLVTLCFAYDDSGLDPVQEASLVLLHEETCSPLLQAAGAAGCDGGSLGSDLLTDWTEFVCTASGVAKGDCASGQEGSTLAGYITQAPVDTANNTICGRVGSFSQFVAAVRTEWTAAIDIQPDDPYNRVTRRSRGKLEVAILSAPQFDATEVVVSSVELAGVAALAKAEDRDVDGDGDVDRIVKFSPQALGLTPGTHELVLTGQLSDGRSFEASDMVRVVK